MQACERLLTACIEGRRSWFPSGIQIEISWNYIEQLKQLAASGDLPLYPYLPGTRGPREAETCKRLWPPLAGMGEGHGTVHKRRNGEKPSDGLFLHFPI